MRTLSLLFCLGFGSVVYADDAEAPSLATRTDRIAHGHPSAGTSADAVGVVFGEYAIGLHFAPSRHFALTVAPGWRNTDRHGPRLGVGFELLPLGRGLDGLVVATALVAAWLPSEQERDRVELGAAAHVGYRAIWRGVLVEGALGAERRFVWGDRTGRSWRPVVRLALGYSWG